VPFLLTTESKVYSEMYKNETSIEAENLTLKTFPFIHVIEQRCVTKYY
jgi:hypothetical protein